MTRPPDHDALLEFWFGDTRNDPSAIGNRMGFWFSPGADAEHALHDQFGDWPDRAATGALRDWPDTPAGRLALILVLDQLPRTFRRGTARAFEHDFHALSLSLAGIQGNVDRDLGLAERAFFYMPLQHSEDRLTQDLSVAVCEERLVDAFPDHAETAAAFTKYAHLHRDIIRRFGRYPHRNHALGRESTAAEREYLQSAPRFGQ